MTEKIEWYKEVLELEPNSKVFFPLARMLAEEQRFDEAVAVLEHGLERHGEFLEARLFFIELLHKTGRREACARQIDKLSSMFSAYAGFWQAWAACLSASDGSPDTASVLRFLAAHFMRGPISLHEVLDRGIASLLDEPQSQQNSSGSRSRTVDAAAQMPGQPAPGQDALLSESAPLPLLPEEDDLKLDLTLKKFSAGTAVEDDDVPFEEADGEGFDPDTAMAEDEALPEPLEMPGREKTAAVTVQASDVADTQPASNADDADDSEERFSLRTRSMAEVLAEQGDIKGALDIYHELAAVAVAPEESADLQQRIATLSARLGSAQEMEQEQPPQQKESASGKDKLISMLEALAERVEARAQD